MNTVLIGAMALAAWSASGEVYHDYYGAYRAAKDQGRMLLVDFESGVDFSRLDASFLDRHVICSVPLDYEFDSQRMIDHPAFRALERSRGIVIVDLRNEEQFGKAVNVLPKKHCLPSKITALSDLPVGTLTQRTLIWALRIHPAGPRSVWGTAAPNLMNHASRHSRVQAGANNQHHDMSHPGSSEIVAESWPWNKNVVDAAIDIVWSWSQSPGHWGAASQAWRMYGYDMKTNGQKWFATGVFSQ